MAAEFPSTYQQYKYKTSQALGWLITTATELGIASGTQATYGVQELVYLAKSCVLAGRPMPKKQRRWLKEAISLRRRVSERFREHGCKQSNSTHAFFNDKLELILDYFNPSNAVGAPVSIQPQQETGTSDPQAGRNYFAVLEDKYTPKHDDDNEANSGCSKRTTTEELPAAAGSPKAYRANEVNPLADDPLMQLFCLLDDAHEIKTYIKQLWTRYRQAETDLVTAAFVTSYACNHLGALEQDFNQNHDSLNNHRSKTLFIHYQACLGASIYEEFCKEGHGDLEQRLEETGWQPDKEMRGWTMEHAEILMSSFSTAAEQSEASATDEWLGSLIEDHGGHCDIDVLVADLRRLLTLHTEANGFPAYAHSNPGPDVLTYTLRRACLPQRKSWLTTEVFMVSLMLEVLDTEGLGEHIDTDVQRYLRYVGFSRVRAIGSEIAKESENPDKWSYGGNPVMDAYTTVLESRLSASRSSSIFNPIILGKVLQEFMEMANLRDMNWINHSGYMANAAHHYHGARVCRPDQGYRWPDMDAVIYLQRIQLFSSSDLPTTHRNCLVRMLLCHGLKLHEITSEPDEEKLSRKGTTKRKSAAQVFRLRMSALRSGPRTADYDADMDNAQADYFAKRNTPGWKRELYVPFLDIHTTKETRTQERPSLRRSAAREACPELEEANQKSMAGNLSFSQRLDQLERTIRDNVAIMFFDFAKFNGIVLSGLSTRLTKEEDIELVVDPESKKLSGVSVAHLQRDLLNHELCRTSNVSTEWKEFCKGVNIKIPDEPA